MPAYTNATQTVPKVFKEIIKNDAEREAIHAKGDTMTQDDWRRLGALSTDKKALRRGAEEVLKWNRDKGNGPAVG
jgi:hypothetical protein